MGGTVTHLSGSIVNVTPASGTTTAAAPNQALSVAGVVTGPGTITVKGSSAGGTHDVAKVSVTVTGG